MADRYFSPNYIRLSVAVVISDSSDYPVEIADGYDRRTAHDRRATYVRQPHPDLTGARIAPKYVKSAITIEIASAGNRPVQISDRRNTGSGTDIGAIHEPYPYLTGHNVVPKHVTFTVAIGISIANDLPVEVADSADRRTRNDDRNPARLRS